MPNHPTNSAEKLQSCLLSIPPKFTTSNHFSCSTLPLKLGYIQWKLSEVSSVKQRKYRTWWHYLFSLSPLPLTVTTSNWEELHVCVRQSPLPNSTRSPEQELPDSFAMCDFYLNPIYISQQSKTSGLEVSVSWSMKQWTFSSWQEHSPSFSWVLRKGFPFFPAFENLGFSPVTTANSSFSEQHYLQLSFKYGRKRN